MTTSTACELSSQGEEVVGLELQRMVMARMSQLMGQLGTFVVDIDPVALPAPVHGSLVGTVANNAVDVFVFF